MLNESTTLNTLNGSKLFLDTLRYILIASLAATVFALIYALYWETPLRNYVTEIIALIPGQLSALVLTVTAERLVNFNDHSNTVEYNHEKRSAYLYTRANLNFAFNSMNFMSKVQGAPIYKVTLITTMKSVQKSFKNIYSKKECLVHLGEELTQKLDILWGHVLGLTVLTEAMKNSQNTTVDIDQIRNGEEHSLRSKISFLASELQSAVDMCEAMTEKANS